MKVNIFIKRTQNLITEPKREFIRISKEEKKPDEVFLTFILPYLLLYAVASYLGTLVFKQATFDTGSGIILKNILLVMVVTASGIYTTSVIINEMLPFFHAKKSRSKTFSMVAYTLTPVYLSLVFAGLIPNLAILINLVGLYSIILFWIAASAITDMTTERRQIFVPISLLIIVLVFLFIRIILGAIFSL